MPFPMATFFNYCTDLRILETDGGSWRFRHQILQDYFYNHIEIKYPNNKTLMFRTSI